jgi:Putative restriction endonuclease
MPPISPAPTPAAQPQSDDNDSLLPVPPEVIPTVEHLVIDDGKPAESIFIEKLRRLLTGTLYDSWSGPGEGRTFKVLSDVGLFFTPRPPPLCPDVMLAVDVEVPVDLSRKENRAYFVWVVGKVPDVVIEIVADRSGGEDGDKMRAYARMGIPYYVIFDPEQHLTGEVLRAFCLQGRTYVSILPDHFPEIGLGLTLWQGAFEGQRARWLRWCDPQGNVIPTAHEQVVAIRRQTERLQAELRKQGINPASSQ